MYGKWSCMDIRMGTYQCSCDCKHGKTICEHCSNHCTEKGFSIPRPATLFEKLDDAFKILRDYWEALKVYDCPFPRVEDIVKSNTKEELRTAICILKFQCKAYRKVLLKDEHKMIWSFCGFCNEKQWWYRLPETSFYPSKHNGIIYEFPVNLDGHLNTMFHCMKCHLIAYESDLSRIEYREAREGLETYIKSKPALKSFLDDMETLSRPLHIQRYYRNHRPDLENVPIEQFFIVKDGKYFCIGCGCYYTRKYDAERHRVKFWGGNNDDYRFGCQKGVSRMIEQKQHHTSNELRG